MLGEALDRAALAGRVAPLEDQHEFLPRLLRPELDLEQFGLKPRLLRLVAAAAEAGLIGIIAALERLPERGHFRLCRSGRRDRFRGDLGGGFGDGFGDGGGLGHIHTP
jgi:hypothetical protein